MLTAYRSAFDPEIQAEGTIDPLGFAPIGSRPENYRGHVVPGDSNGRRFWIIEPSVDILAIDGTTSMPLICLLGFNW